MLKKLVISFFLFFLVISKGWAAVSDLKGLKQEPKQAEGHASESASNATIAYGKLPLYFIENNGQIDKAVKYYEKGSGHTTSFTKEGVYLSLNKDNDSPASIVKLIPLNADKNPEIIAEDKQEGKINYLIGNDPKKWQKNIPTYKAVTYKGLYKDIDIKFYGNNRQLEYDIVVQAGADPSKVKFAYEGIEGMKITDDGALEIALKQGNIIQKKPYIYQDINGKRVEVDGKFKILDSKPTTDNSKIFSYGFQVASYDKEYPLVLDPIIIYSTFLGGSGIDGGQDIAVDGLGNAYIIGKGSSYTSGGGFVTKIDSYGSLIYSTFLGGVTGYGIAVDGSGSAYITGQTSGGNFPLVNPIDATAGYGDAFVTKLDPSGSTITYSTYLGGQSYGCNESGRGIAVDGSGNAYITGSTACADFPIVNPMYGHSGSSDAFVTKINASGTAIVYSTYLGGSGGDSGSGIAVDGAGNAYITGSTMSSNFPLVTPIDGTLGVASELFVTKINPMGTALVYSTYLGGNNVDIGKDIAVDGSGNVYITGYTRSPDFPLVNPIDGTFGGYFDGFVVKINSSGSSLVYSTYLGGSGEDRALGIAVDETGNVYVTGFTVSIDFPLVNPVDATIGDVYPEDPEFDVFVTKIDSSGLSLIYSTYLGGDWGWDQGNSIAVDGAGNAYITGITYSSDFPLVNPIDSIPDTTYGDPFVTKIATPQFTLTVTKAGTSGTGVVTSSPAGIDCGADCSEPYNPNTIVNLIATPDLGSAFAGWSGDADCLDGQVTMDANKSCTATFHYAF